MNHLGKDTDYLGKISCAKIIQKIISGKNFPAHELNEEFKYLNAITKSITILSAETLSTISPNFSFSLVNSNGKNNAIKFKSSFDKYFDEIEIIIGIRSQKTMLQACYKQWYHLIVGEQPKFQNPENWIKSNFHHNISDAILLFNYDELIQTYKSVFGSQRVHILIYEELQNSKDQYYRKLADILNIDKSYVGKSMEKNIQNKTQLSETGMVIIPGLR